MDEWACEHVQPSRHVRRDLPVGPLLCVIAGADARTRLVTNRRASPAQATVRGRCSSPTIRPTPAPSHPHCRDGTPRRPPARHPAPTRTRTPRHHQHPPTRDRHDRDHQHNPHTAHADDPSQRRTRPLTSSPASRAHRSACPTSIKRRAEGGRLEMGLRRRQLFGRVPNPSAIRGAVFPDDGMQ
jgi:hypothetical protein